MRSSKKGGEKSTDTQVLRKPKAKLEQAEPDAKRPKKDDVTLRKEKDLLARSIIETAQAIILVLDTQGRIVDFNPFMEEITGYKIQEVAGRDWFDTFIPERDRQRIRELFLKAVHDIRTRGNVNPIVTKNGEEREIEWYDKTLKDSDGKVVGLLAIGLDVTERIRGQQALQESEERLKTASDAAVLGIWDWDLTSGKITWAGHQAQLLGYEQDEFDGRYETFRKRVHPQDLPGLEAAIEKSQSDGTEYLHEYRVIWPDGTIRWISGKGRCQYDKYGKISRMIGTAQDITDRKKVEQVLRENENLVRQVLNATPNPIFAKDKDGRYILVNKADAELHGTTPEAMVGKTDIEYAHLSMASEQEAERFLADDRKVIENRQPKFVPEESFTLPNGTTRWFQTTKIPISLQGNPDCVLGIAVDITERKKAEQVLRERKELFKATIESTADGILVVNDKGRVTHSNARMAQMWRIPAELFATGDDAKLLSFVEKQLVEPQAFLDKVQSLYKSNYEDFDTLVFKDGRVFERYSCPLLREGKNVGRVWSFRDITDRKKAEEKLIDYQARLKSLASQLTLAEESERRRIATEMHASIGQSLIISKMKLDELRASAPSKEMEKTLGEVCSLLAKNIQETRTLTFDLSSPVLYELGFEQAVAEWLDERIESKYGIETEFEDDGLEKPLDDEVRVFLFRDVRELLFNVVKHAQAKKVKVTVSKLGDRIRVSIEDDGLGFNPDKLAEMAVKKGAFGLFSIRQRLELLGGRLDIDSAPGRGTKITITAPLKREK